MKYLYTLLIAFAATTLFAQAPKDSIQVDTQYVAAILFNGFQDEQVIVPDTTTGKQLFYTITQPSFLTVNRILQVVTVVKYAYQPLQPNDPKYDPSLVQSKLVPVSRTNKITIANTTIEVEESRILSAIPIQPAKR